MTARWLWAVGALLCAQLLVPRLERPPRSAPARELKRLTAPRPPAVPRVARQE